MKIIKYILLFDWCAVFGTASGTYVELRALMVSFFVFFAIYAAIIFGIYTILEVANYNEIKKLNFFYIAFAGGLGVVVPVCPFIVYPGIYFVLKFLYRRMIRDLQAARDHLLSGNIDYEYSERSMLQQVEWNRKTEEEKEAYRNKVNRNFRSRTKTVKVLFSIIYIAMVVFIAVMAI